MFKRTLLTSLLLLACLILGACSLGGVQIEVPKTLPRVDLGEDTLRRIDDINARLESGLEIGPETRSEIREINRTLRQVADEGLGLNEATLSRIDALLSQIEAGVGITVGLDDETRATLNRLVDSLDAAPDQWGSVAQEIIRTLEGSTASVAHQMAEEVKSVIGEATHNAQRLTIAVGTEFRCNVDFMIGRAGDSIDAFIGRTLIGRLRAIIAGEETEPLAPIPWVCGILPDQVVLRKAMDRLEAEKVLIVITGYDFTDANLPVAYLADEQGQRLSFAPLFPYGQSSYQIGLNLQGHDFSTIPVRSRLVFEWPDLDTVEIPIVLPTEPTPEPTTVPVAELEIVEDLEVRFGPGDNYRAIGRAERGARYEVTGRNGDSTWWQIDYAGKIGWVPADKVVRNDIAVAVAPSFPPTAPVADFSADPTSGVAPLTVSFTDQSTGESIRWQWSFGDGGTSVEQNPTWTYDTPGIWQVRLTVVNDQGESSQVAQIAVEAPTPTDTPKPPPAAPVADLEASTYDGPAPLLVTFTDRSQGSPSTWSWEFGDGGTSPEQNPTWTYNTPGTYEVRLTVSNEGGSSTKAGVTILVRAFQSGYVFFQHFGDLPPGKIRDWDTGIAADQYTCGIVGVSVEGDIQESGASGDLIAAYLQKVPEYGGTWHMNAEFRTHGDPEQWELWIMCLDNRAQGPNGFVWKRYGAGGAVNDAPWNYVQDTEMSTDKYYCGIAGFAARDGDIQERWRSRIFQMLLDSTGPTWQIQAHFNTQEGARETWRLVDVLCVNKEPGVFEYGEFSFPERDISEHQTHWSERDYLCGIAGMLAYDGDIWEDGYGYIVNAYMHTSGGMWYTATSFRTHQGDGELWNVNVLCVSRPIAEWR